MKKLLNILYVTNPQSYLYKDGLNIVVAVEQKDIFRVPVINIEGIVTFGYLGCSPGLMKLCADNKISLCFLSPHGRFIGRFQGPQTGNVLLRKIQYELYNNEDVSLHLACIVIASKISNYRSLLQRHQRDHGQREEIENSIIRLRQLQRQAFKCVSKADLLGIEGLAAKIYFGTLPHLILNTEKTFNFSGRNKRPPKDAVNALLSFAYSLLTNEVTAALETVGLDAYLGFYHTLRPGRTSLALDMIEEFRAYICDRFVLSLINRKQLRSNHFFYQGEEAIQLTDDGRKIFLSAFQNRKKEEITHPYLNEPVPLGLLPYLQAVLMSRHLRNQIDDYPPFISK